jgi:hypothetical protein
LYAVEGRDKRDPSAKQGRTFEGYPIVSAKTENVPQNHAGFSPARSEEFMVNE